MWSLVAYSNCFELNHSKEQTVINLSTYYAVIKGTFVFIIVYYCIIRI